MAIQGENKSEVIIKTKFTSIQVKFYEIENYKSDELIRLEGENFWFNVIVLNSGLNLQGFVKNIDVIDKGIECYKKDFSKAITKYTRDERYKDNQADIASLEIKVYDDDESPVGDVVEVIVKLSSVEVNYYPPTIN